MELDFFKYAQNSSGKRKATTSGELESKKRRLDFIGDDEKAETDEEVGNGHSQAFTPSQKHRVIAKGSNVPECVETFAALKDRYQIPSHLLANLSQSGYSQPTAIQSYGMPILLEVGRFTSSQMFKSSRTS
jgi:ATP-dependent RNA helicase DDX52/ROK1